MPNIHLRNVMQLNLVRERKQGDLVDKREIAINICEHKALFLSLKLHPSVGS